MGISVSTLRLYPDKTPKTRMSLHGDENPAENLQIFFTQASFILVSEDEIQRSPQGVCRAGNIYSLTGHIILGFFQLSLEFVPARRKFLGCFLREVGSVQKAKQIDQDRTFRRFLPILNGLMDGIELGTFPREEGRNRVILQFHLFLHAILPVLYHLFLHIPHGRHLQGFVEFGFIEGKIRKEKV